MDAVWVLAKGRKVTFTARIRQAEGDDLRGDTIHIPAPPAVRPLPPEGGFWTTITTYATELAPVAGPLLETIGHTANAIDRADRRNQSLEAETCWLEGDWVEKR
jgi:hypothetical protein